MDKRILFSIDRGSFAEGFDVTLQALQEGQTYLSVMGRLPEEAQLGKLYQTFRETYFRLENIRIVVPPEQVTHPQGCLNHSSELNTRFQSWLDLLTFKVQTGLVCALKDLGSTQLILQIQEEVNAPDADILAKLPWHTWHLFEDNKVQPEVTLGRLSGSNKRQRFGKVVKILAIIGHSEGIDTQHDLHALRQIRGASVTALEQPLRLQLTKKLWQQRWDILFFAGHSNSEGTTGRIYINETESLTLQEVKASLKQAGNRGLKLAIFNSCDGLGLVSELANSGIPWIIVMREPVPDQVAQLFLSYFLESFSQGKSFLLAVQNARHQLEGIQDKFPCATWLPVVCQNSAATLLTWPQWSTWLNRYTSWLNQLKFPISSKPKGQRKWRINPQILLLGLCGMALSLGLAIMFRPPFPSIEACNNFPKYIDCGQNLSFLSSDTRKNEDQTLGMDYFRNGNYGNAFKSLTKAWDSEKDPNTLISLNNVNILRDIKDGNLDRKNIFTIAIASSFSNIPKEIVNNILLGIAWRQKEFNEEEPGIFKLFVIMGNDYNNKFEAVKLAKELTKNKNILGIIGPYSSSITYYCLDEYTKEKLVTISATSTAKIDDFQKENPKRNQDFSWFFRPVSTTDIGAKALVKSLKERGYKEVKIFYQDRDLFGKSFYKSFKDQLAAEKIKTIGQDIQLSASSQKKETEINELKKKYSDKKISLVIIADAYTRNSSIIERFEILDKNNGYFFVAGNNPLFEMQLLDHFSGRKKILENMIVSTPWHPSKDAFETFNNFVKIKPDENRKYTRSNDPKMMWHVAMSYDATQMFIEAISKQLSEGKTPSREGMKQILSNPKFQTEGLTGIIKLNGSDRREQIYALIRPDCSSNSCDWIEAK
jgi:ABC-type branched-subunit amino acid transport system substrate-binding protein